MPADQDDEQAIADLLARYCSFLDRGRHDDWIALFDPEGRFEVYGRTFVGPEGLRQMAESAPGGLHLAGDAIVDVEGDRASVEQSFLFIDQATRELRIGWYDDVLVRAGGRWHFAVRRSTFLNHDGPSERPTSRRSLQDVYNSLASYDALLDDRQLEAWLDLFLEEGVLSIGGRTLQTSAERSDFARSSPRGRHLSNLPIVSGNLETGRVHAESTFCFWGLDGLALQMGSYSDDLVYRKGSWRFAARKIDLIEATDAQ